MNTLTVTLLTNKSSIIYNSLVVIMAYLQLQLSNSLLHSDDIFLQCCLFSLQLGQLLLQSLALCLLVRIVPLNLLLYSM